MKHHLCPTARALLNCCPDGTLIGVVFENAGEIQVFRAGAIVDKSLDVYPGHSELVRAGRVPAKGVRGFSFQLKNGKVRSFYRNSGLNGHLRDSTISDGEMHSILAEMSIKLADDFKSYP